MGAEAQSPDVLKREAQLLNSWYNGEVGNPAVSSQAPTSKPFLQQTHPCKITTSYGTVSLCGRCQTLGAATFFTSSFINGKRD